MRSISDNTIDLTITSPPYNLGKIHKTGKKSFRAYDVYVDDLPEDEYQNEQINVLNEIYRITKEDGSILYNHKNRIKDGKQISPYEWLFKTNWTIKQELVWFNGSQNFDKCRFYPMTERIYWMSKGTKTGFHNVINQHDLLKDLPVGSGTTHKRSFPVTLAQRFIICFPEAKLIFDPYMGSGSTALAAIKENRKYIGSEISKTYYELSLKRIQMEVAQTRLF